MALRVVIDPGHAPGNGNKGNNGYYENKGMWTLSNYLRDALIRCGFEVKLTRTENQDPSLTERGKTAAAFGADLFISEHSNAANGTARGVEVYYSVARRGDKAFAAIMSKSISTLMGNADRGAKVRESTQNPYVDYYTVLYAAESGKVPHVLLVENGFHDNIQDEVFLLVESNLEAIAETQAKVICGFLGIVYKENQMASTPILNSPTATAAQAKAWAESKKAASFFIELAEVFWQLGQAVGVDPAVAYAQSAKETGYGKFGGVLNESYCNPCGMKTSTGGDDYDKNAHKKFSSWKEGIKAQIDHIALYAGKSGYPKSETPDPRHFPYLLGKCTTVESLGGNWAPSATYGNEIAAMMAEIKKTEAATTPDMPKWQIDGLEKLVKAGIIKDELYWKNKMLKNQTVSVGEFIGLLANML